MDERSQDAMARIADAFNSYFSNWSIQLSPTDIRPGTRDSIAQRGWGIRYVVETDDNGDLYLEFYATNRMTNDRHVVISSSGTIEHVESISSMVFFDPNVGGDRDRASRENIERNQRTAEDLKAKGLFPSGNLNTFLSMGGMEASDALKEMGTLLEQAGLPMPPLPVQLRDQLRRVRKWCYATRDIDPLEMYRFDKYLVEAVIASPEPYFAFSHAGHGINSYAINYQVVVGPLALFAQVPWGGGYMDKQRQTDSVRHMFERCAELLGQAPDSRQGRRLLVAVSELRRQRICGWIPPGLDEERVRRWLRPEKLTEGDPFAIAANLLTETDSR